MKKICLFLFLLHQSIRCQTCSWWECKFIATSVVPHNQKVHQSIDNERVFVSSKNCGRVCLKRVQRRAVNWVTPWCVPSPQKCKHAVFDSAAISLFYSFWCCASYHHIMISSNRHFIIPAYHRSSLSSQHATAGPPRGVVSRWGNTWASYLFHHRKLWSGKRLATVRYLRPGARWRIGYHIIR